MDIFKYPKLIAFLKRQQDGYVAKKSKVLEMNDVKFLTNAPNDSFLMLKVALIFGLNGACRRDELCKLLTNDIQDTGTILVITLRDTKTNKKRIFIVTPDAIDWVNGVDLNREYSKLHPKHIDHNRFFLFYKSGRCNVQPVGINTFAAIPKKIAEYLELPDPCNYTGHCLRRTSATFLADSGADIQTLKRHGGWR